MSASPAPSSEAAPLVSVVIPTCDRSDQITTCLEALALQIYDPIEVIVVDDHSADDTPQALERLAELHPRLNLIVICNEQNLGANPSRNRGVESSSGEFIAFLDSDCVPNEDWLATLMTGFTGKDVAAVTGLVEDPPPGNVWELAFRGTHRLATAGPAHRLVGGNMCVRREQLLQFGWDENRLDRAADSTGRPDVTTSGGCDEEGLFLKLRAAGYAQHVVPEAVVLHEHGYDRRSFFRQAWRGGRSAATLVYTYQLAHRLDLLPFILAWATLLGGLPIALLTDWWWLLAIPVFFFTGGVAAICYNEVSRKGKSIGQLAMLLPVMLLYYQVRLLAYVLQTIRLMLRGGPERVDLARISREAHEHDHHHGSDARA